MASSSTAMEDENSIKSESEFDMAMACLLELGFSKPLITRTLLKLLKVYGGNEGWVLIKENGYEVVVDSLISNPKSSRSTVKDAHPSNRKASSPAVAISNDLTKKLVDDETDNGGCSVRRTTSRSSIDKCHIQQNNWMEKNMISDDGPSIGGNNASKVSDIDSSELYSHQRGLWTKNGSLAAPKWFRETQEKSSNADSGDRDSNDQKKSPRDTGHGTKLSSKHDVARGETHKNSLNTDSHKRDSHSQKEFLTSTENDIKAPNRLDVARMSAFKLTRRRDGCPNPMFSRLRKLKENREASENNLTPCQSLKQDDIDAAVPPGFENNLILIQASENYPTPCQLLKQDDIDTAVPPGFEKNLIVSPGLNTTSGELPQLSVPAFNDPDVSGLKSLGKALEGTSPMSSPDAPLSPDVPPGFWGFPDDPQCSPTQLPAFWEQKCKYSYENSKTRNSPTCVFIAGIPVDCENVELKLRDMVNKILEGFRFIPIIASFPRRISVFGDHSLVEFQSQAVAGIFLDAYRSKPQLLTINGEQLLAARTIQLMRLDAQLRHVAAKRIKGEALVPANVFYLGNIPTEWQDELKLKIHLMSVFDHSCVEGVSNVISVYTIPGFPDAYVSLSSRDLASRFYYSCFSRKELLDEISTSLVISNNPLLLPRASCVL